MTLPGPTKPLVNGLGGAKFGVPFRLDSVKQLQCKGLAIVTDEVVNWLPLSDTLNHRFSCSVDLALVEHFSVSSTNQPAGSHRH